MESNCFIFLLRFTYILMPHNMMILYFRLPYFHVSNSALFLHSISVLSSYIDVDLTLSNRYLSLTLSLLWRHSERDSVSYHQRLYCLLKCLFRRRSKITSKLRVTGLCAWNSPGTGEFPAQKANNAENVSIWWRHHVVFMKLYCFQHYPNDECQSWKSIAQLASGVLTKI